MGGVVINADSAQVYRDLRIVTARPTLEEEERAPHRLYGYRDGAGACSAADWAGDARREIAAAHAAGRLPILAGGTGLYVRTLLDGIAPVPPIEPEVREAVRALAADAAYSALKHEDPVAAQRLPFADTTRVARALEVVRSTGRSLSDWQKRRTGGIAASVELIPLILLPPREWLYPRCNQRFDEMISGQGLSEVNFLLKRELDPSLPVMRAIGVREIAAYLRGELDRQGALEAGRTATRQYAKRQYTWFSRQPPPHWPRFTGALDCEAQANALAGLDARLSR